MNPSIINRSEINYQWSQTLTKRNQVDTKLRTSRLIRNCGISTGWVDELMDNLFPVISNRAVKPTRQALQAALLNIANSVSQSSAHGQPSGFLCSLSNTYKKVPRRYRDHDFSLKKMTDVLLMLKAEGLLECHKGYRSEGHSAGLTTLWLPTIKAEELISSLSDKLVIEFFRHDIETLWLKASNGSLMDYEDDAMTNDMRLLLRETNDLRASINWFYRPYKTVMSQPDNEMSAIADGDLRFKRQFNEAFTRGGRFYANVQQLTKQERSTIIANGESTLELDIKSLHPRMLYNLKGIQAPADCYDISGYDREVMKMVALITLNAKSEGAAIKALSMKLSMNFDFARGAIEAFRLKHKAIAEFLFSSSWALLQYQDSELAKDIMNEAAEHTIPVIPVHDSFISSMSNSYKLSEIMNRQYEKRFGFLPVIEPSLSCLSAGIAA